MSGECGGTLAGGSREGHGRATGPSPIRDGGGTSSRRAWDLHASSRLRQGQEPLCGVLVAQRPKVDARPGDPSIRARKETEDAGERDVPGIFVTDRPLMAPDRPEVCLLPHGLLAEVRPPHVPVTEPSRTPHTRRRREVVRTARPRRCGWPGPKRVRRGRPGPKWCGRPGRSGADAPPRTGAPRPAGCSAPLQFRPGRQLLPAELQRHHPGADFAQFFGGGEGGAADGAEDVLGAVDRVDDGGGAEG